VRLRGLGGRAAVPLKPASWGPALRRDASGDALLAAPPLPWLRPPMPRIRYARRRRQPAA